MSCDCYALVGLHPTRLHFPLGEICDWPLVEGVTWLCCAKPTLLLGVNGIGDGWKMSHLFINELCTNQQILYIDDADLAGT